MTEKSLTGAACLSETERRVVGGIPFRADWSRVRLYRGTCGGTAGWLRRVVLRASHNRAVALGNRVFLPARCEQDLGVLAHELTHCAQYQAWGAGVYFARGAITQLRELMHQTLGLGSSAYSYRVEPGKPFDSYGMEQQAQMVEDRFRQGSGRDHPIPSA
jgi:hypothetical protein